MTRADDAHPFAPQPKRPIPEIEGTIGLMVEVASSNFAGTLTAITQREVTLVDRRGRERHFPRTEGAFIVNERRVTLMASPVATVSARQPTTTASGSVRISHQAKTARPSRIYVEGVHDAALIEQVWGDDLRAAAIVVEPLHGIDDLASHVLAFGATPKRRLAVLLDHLTLGTKESRLKATINDPNVLIVGHDFVDIFAAVKPERLGVTHWPDVPRDEDYKQGLATRLGYANATELFHAVIRAVRTWTDFDQSLIKSVEAALDFVTLADREP
ncbi:MAG: DUF3097 family protein [Nitriliruptoraceae bacterium]